METSRIAAAGLQFSRIGLGTWAMGGWMWGGTDEQESIRTIHSAIDRGITLIDTAPVYGFGKSEEIVGKALASGGLRQRVCEWIIRRRPVRTACCLSLINEHSS